MIKYTIYLEKNGYSTKAIPTYQRSAKCFNDWCKQYGTSPNTIDYKRVLKYMQHLKKGKLKARTLKGYIGSLKIYFDYLVTEESRTDNIIKNINIKGIKKEVIHNILEAEELEDLYYSYDVEKNKTNIRKRNRIIVGLLMYQGLNTRDLQNLQVENIQLYKGKIDVLGTKKSNGRELELKPWQLMEFMEYIHEVRPKLLQKRTCIERSRNKETEQLFFPMGSSLKLHNVITRIAKELKEINHNFINIKQVRTSVIIGWLKQYNLRKTQYLAGHKYISSTERYQQDDLESLHETINTFHPLQ